MMKIFNAWMEKVGVDKLLHFFLAAWLVSECKAFGIGIGCIAWIVVVVISWIKEDFLDDHVDARDIFAGALGGFVSLLIGIFKCFILN